MPWSESDPPEAARKYGERCRRAFVHAANSVLDSTGDEGKAIAAGHSAAKQCEGKQKAMDPIPTSVFKVYAPTLIASRDPQTQKRRLEGVASSTIIDHDGDRITERALHKMADSAIGMTIFLNHEYKVPEDVFGKVVRARVVKDQTPDPKTGREVYLLRMGIEVDESNPRAVQAHDQLANGTRLGLSIGAMVPEGGAKFEKTAKGGGWVVDDLDLIETSVVSIPANPRSFIDYAVKAMVGQFPEKLMVKRLELTKQLDEEGAGDEESPEQPEGEATEEVAAGDIAEPDGGQPAEDAGVSAEGAEPDAGEAAPADPPDDLEKTRISVWEGDRTIEVDTGRSKPKNDGNPSAQDGDDPEDAGSSTGSGGETTKALAVPEIIRTHGTSPEELVKALTGQLKARDKENADLRMALDAVIGVSETTIQQARDVMGLLERLPVGRKTAGGAFENPDLEKASARLDSLDAIYSAEVRTILKGNRR